MGFSVIRFIYATDRSFSREQNFFNSISLISRRALARGPCGESNANFAPNPPRAKARRLLKKIEFEDYPSSNG